MGQDPLGVWEDCDQVWRRAIKAGMVLKALTFEKLLREQGLEPGGEPP